MYSCAVSSHFVSGGIIGAKATNGRNAHEETCSAPSRSVRRPTEPSVSKRDSSSSSMVQSQAACLENALGVPSDLVIKHVSDSICVVFLEPIVDGGGSKRKPPQTIEQARGR